MARITQEISADWRFEYKYPLSMQDYYRVRCALTPYMKKDSFSWAAPNGKYFVRSLYFDTSDFQNYQEKVGGDCDRVKLRIRTYTDQPNKDTMLRVEFKARKGITVEKHQSWVPFDVFQHFMTTFHWPQTDDPVLLEFERYIHMKALQPKVIVQYYREGYSAITHEEIRATFDHKVSSAHSTKLFPETAFFHKHHPGMVVFEIKSLKNQPSWLQKIIQEQALCIKANSKYTQGIERACADVVIPSRSY